MNLSTILKPQSIAIIGGGFWGQNVILRAKEFGYKGELLPVHPKKGEIAGIPTVNSVRELKKAPDMAFVAVNRKTTIKTVGELTRIGCGGVICFASGFAEAEKEYRDGLQLQEKLIEVSGSMPLLGPNCYGFINALDHTVIWPDAHGLSPIKSGVAILSQSSNIALNITMQRRSLPIGFVIAVGNQAKISLAQIALSLIEDERITAIGCYIESVHNVEDWHKLAQRSHALDKPIVALKVGVSELARIATKTHTGSLAGSHVGFQALFQKLGIAEMGDIPSFLEALKIAHHCGWVERAEIAAMCCSGGEASLIADLAHEFNIKFPPLPQKTNDDLYQTLGDKVARANPLDYHTYIWGDYDALKATYSAMVTGPWAFTLLILDYPKIDPGTYDTTIRAILYAAKFATSPVGVMASMHENMPTELADRLSANGVVPLFGFCEAMKAIRALVRPDPNLDPILPPPRISDHQTLYEFEAKQVLSKALLPIPKGYAASSEKELIYCSRKLNFPLVLKGLGFAHKTDHQAVKIGISNEDELIKVARAMPSREFLIEEMIKDGVCELLVGIVLDPSHGYVLTIGFGGITTELLRDTSSVLLPVKRNDIQKTIDKLAIAPILYGYRGEPGIAMDALLDFLEKLCNLVTTPCPTTRLHRIVECEINPLLCSRVAVVALDALIIESTDNG